MTSLAQGAAGLALVLSFGLLCTRQLGGALILLTVQAVAVSVAAAAEQQALVAPIALATAGIAAPMLLRRLIDRHALPYGTTPTGGATRAIVVAAVLAVLCAPIDRAGLAQAILLLGVLLIATRRPRVMQLIGLVSMQNGMALAAIGVPDLPWKVRLAAALPILPGLVFASLWDRPGIAAGRAR
jgi:hydrogenase-4 component E